MRSARVYPRSIPSPSHIRSVNRTPNPFFPAPRPKSISLHPIMQTSLQKKKGTHQKQKAKIFIARRPVMTHSPPRSPSDPPDPLRPTSKTPSSSGSRARAGSRSPRSCSSSACSSSSRCRCLAPRGQGPPRGPAACGITAARSGSARRCRWRRSGGSRSRRGCGWNWGRDIGRFVGRGRGWRLRCRGRALCWTRWRRWRRSLGFVRGCVE